MELRKKILISVVTLSLLLFGFLVFGDWQYPTQSPPGGDDPGPITTADIPQHKEGALDIGGRLEIMEEKAATKEWVFSLECLFQAHCPDQTDWSDWYCIDNERVRHREEYQCEEGECVSHTEYENIVCPGACHEGECVE